MDHRAERTGASACDLLDNLMLKARTKTDPEFKLFDVVELRSDVVEAGKRPWGGSVTAGTHGTIVEVLPDGFYLVEFGDAGRQPDAILTLPANLLALD